MAEKPSREIEFQTSIEWRGHGFGEVFVDSERHSRGIVTSPPVFGGMTGPYNPEHLLLASVASCTMLSFLHFVRTNKIELVSYTSDIVGILTKGKDGYSFTKITIDAKIVVNEGHREKAEEAAHLGHRFCLITNSLKSEVNFNFTIEEVKTETKE